MADRRQLHLGEATIWTAAPECRKNLNLVCAQPQGDVCLPLRNLIKLKHRGAQSCRVSLTDRLSVPLMPAGPDPAPAGPLQSGGEDPPRCRAGELDGPRGLERAGRGPSSSGQRRGGHRVLPDRPGAGGQQPRGALHHHPPRALSRRPPAALPLRPRGVPPGVPGEDEAATPKARDDHATDRSDRTQPTPDHRSPPRAFLLFSPAR